MAKRLERHESGDKNFDVACVYGNCSRGDLKASIDKCFEDTAETALFYFAGHGMSDQYGEHIVTTDEADLSLSEILVIVNNSKCRNKVVILDSCFSGAMGNQNSPSNTAAIESGVTILTACTRQQVAMECKGHGVFTTLLLAALDGEAADLMGNITPGAIYAFIDKSLGAWGQRPVFKTNVMAFSPLRKVKPPIDVQILQNLAVYFQAEDSPYALDPSYEYTNTQSTDKNIRIMKELQKLERVGLVIPCGTEHMYYAAMESKSCQLTAVGRHYWRLAKEKRI